MPFPRRFRRLVWLLLLGSGLGACPSRALVLGGAAAAQNAPPPDDPGWANAVAVNGCSAVYLGNRWVLTVAHVGSGEVTVDGTGFPMQPGSAVRLRSPDGGTEVDLTLFRLQADPGLPALPVAASPFAEDTPVVAIGFGRQRGEPVSYDAGWYPGGTPEAFAGFRWGPGRKGWGSNRIAGTATIDVGSGPTATYVTAFDIGAGATADETQGALNDSGGPVFAKVAGQWQLAAILQAIDRFEGQPSETAIFGNATYAVNLAVYRDQIEAVRVLADPYAIWHYQHFRGAAAPATADPDGDGLTVFQEFVFGTDPSVADAANGPQTALVAHADGLALTATYPRNPTATGVPIVAEVSGDLVHWQTGDGATAVVATGVGADGRPRVVVRDLQTTATAGRRFLRLRLAP